MATSIIMANGKALTMVMVCSAFNPPAINNTEAITPSSDAQKTRCHTGVLRAPPAAKESITKAPESAEVTKRSEEHTSELQSRPHLVCRLLLEKKKNDKGRKRIYIE